MALTPAPSSLVVIFLRPSKKGLFLSVSAFTPTPSLSGPTTKKELYLQLPIWIREQEKLDISNKKSLVILQSKEYDWIKRI